MRLTTSRLLVTSLVVAVLGVVLAVFLLGREDPCERLLNAPIFIAVSDHGSGQRFPLEEAVEEAFRRAGMPRDLTRSDFDVVREESITVYVAVDGYWTGFVEDRGRYSTWRNLQPCSTIPDRPARP